MRQRPDHGSGVDLAVAAQARVARALRWCFPTRTVSDTFGVDPGGVEQSVAASADLRDS
jgi:hypothetical protein